MANSVDDGSATATWCGICVVVPLHSSLKGLTSFTFVDRDIGSLSCLMKCACRSFSVVPEPSVGDCDALGNSVCYCQKSVLKETWKISWRGEKK